MPSTPPPVTDFTETLEKFDIPFVSPANYLFDRADSTVGGIPSVVDTLKQPDTQLVQSLIQTLSATVDELDDTLCDAYSLLNHLRSERDRFGRFLGYHHSVLAPVRKVPVDVLQEIFLYVCASEQAVEWKARAPSVVCQVNSLWRQVALKTPRLWTSVFVRIEDVRVAEQTEMLDVWMERSKALPVSVTFLPEWYSHVEGINETGAKVHSPPDYPLDRLGLGCDIDDLGFSVAHALIPHSHRLASIDIRCAHPREVLHIWHIFREQFNLPILHTFRMAPSVVLDPTTTDPIYTFLQQNAPNLINLFLPHYTHTSPVAFHAESIQTFEGTLCDVSQVVDILGSTSSQLRTAYVRLAPGCYLPPLNTTTLDHLTALALDTSCLADLASLPCLPSLRHVILSNSYPILEHRDPTNHTMRLQYQNQAIPRDIHVEALLPFLRRSGVGLQYLALGFELSEPQLRDVLGVVRNVEGLRLSGRICAAHLALLECLPPMEKPQNPAHIAYGLVDVAASAPWLTAFEAHRANAGFEDAGLGLGVGPDPSTVRPRPQVAAVVPTPLLHPLSFVPRLTHLELGGSLYAGVRDVVSMVYSRICASNPTSSMSPAPRAPPVARLRSVQYFPRQGGYYNWQAYEGRLTAMGINASMVDSSISGSVERMKFDTAYFTDTEDHGRTKSQWLKR